MPCLLEKSGSTRYPVAAFGRFARAKVLFRPALADERSDLAREHARGNR
jgi:hypothetical protein